MGVKALTPMGDMTKTEFLLTIYIRYSGGYGRILLNNTDKNSALMTISLKEKILCRVSRIVFGNMTTHCDNTVAKRMCMRQLRTFPVMHAFNVLLGCSD